MFEASLLTHPLSHSLTSSLSLSLTHTQALAEELVARPCCNRQQLLEGLQQVAPPPHMHRALRSSRSRQLPSVGRGVGASASCGDKLLQKKHLQIWFDDEDEDDIPLDSRASEQRFRKTAADRARKKEDGKQLPVFRCLNIWWGAAGRERWRSSVGVQRQMIWNWRIRGDKVCKDEPSTNIDGAGNKVIEEDSVYVRRMLGTGLGAFSRRGGKKGTIIAIYAGQFYDDDAVAKCKSSSKMDSHKVGWRCYITGAPSGTRGIDGKVSIFQSLISLNHDVVIPNPGQILPNSKYDLRYFIRNGIGCVLNARSCQGANCRVVSEYMTYNQDVEIHMDDQYCPRNIPYHHRVCAHLAILPLFSSVCSFCSLCQFQHCDNQ